ncbi:MAG: lysophospholipid acyltransferase family protein [Pirellulales bacterium]|nr:lysophospholipid acyltransferase family protein [Pirellulales bacterium]
MKIKNQNILRTGGALSAILVRAWFRTLDCRVAVHAPLAGRDEPANAKKRIYILWHEFVPFPTRLHRKSSVSVLASRHTDAVIVADAAIRLGFGVVRGSSSHRGKTRGGEAALREMVRMSRKTHFAITPDGPRGPRRTMSKGPVFLASKLGMPLVAMGVGYDRPWRLPSWDRLALPKPYSRARAIIGPPMYLPRNLDRDGIEHYRLSAERMLNHVTAEAEEWAASGSHKVGETAMTHWPHIDTETLMPPSISIKRRNNLQRRAA